MIKNPSVYAIQGKEAQFILICGFIRAEQPELPFGSADSTHSGSSMAPWSTSQRLSPYWCVSACVRCLCLCVLEGVKGRIGREGERKEEEEEARGCRERVERRVSTQWSVPKPEAQAKSFKTSERAIACLLSERRTCLLARMRALSRTPTGSVRKSVGHVQDHRDSCSCPEVIRA